MSFSRSMGLLNKILDLSSRIIEADIEIYNTRYELTELIEMEEDEKQLLESIESYHDGMTLEMVRDSLIQMVTKREKLSLQEKEEKKDDRIEYDEDED